MGSDPTGFRRRYGPWALVAGGSEGLGAEYVRAAAARGLSVLAVAEQAEPLVGVCSAASREFGVDVRPVVVDLARRDLIESLRVHTEGLEIGLLVCNAALSAIGPFLDLPPDHLTATIDLNCRAPMLLAREYAAPMARRGRGGIVIMSSLAGRQGTALVSAYSATKAFDWVLGEVLYEELREHGVDAMAVCAGATRTPGWERTAPRLDGGAAPPVMDPAQVVEEALDALGRGPSMVPGRANRWASWVMTHLLGRRRSIALLGRQMRRQYPDQVRASASDD